MSTQDIKDRVLGIEGTAVTLTIDRGGEVFDVDVIRGVVNSTVFAYAEDDYIIMELNSFGETTADECKKYLDAYPGYDKIIIDLHIIVSYGVNISSVASNLISNVKYKVEEFSGLKVEKINVLVEGMRAID